MPSMMKTAGALVAALATISSAMPAIPRLSARQVKMYEYAKRQNQAAAAAGLTDVDLLQL
jgi:hypothetical protein